MRTKLDRFSCLLLGALTIGAVGCAHRPAAAPETAAQRIKDSPREKMAAIPPVDPGADPENQDQRFGVESARERGQTAAQQRAERQRCVDIIAGRVPRNGAICPDPKK